MSETKQTPPGWLEVPLPDVVFFQEGPGLLKRQFRDKGIPFVNIRTFRDRRIDKSRCQFLDEDEVNAKYNHFLVVPGDILCSTSGTIGKTAIVQHDDPPLMLNTSVVRFNSYSDAGPDRGFIHVFLQSEYFRKQAIKASTGTAQLNVGPTHLRKMSFLLPPLGEQRRIVAKIEELFSDLDAGVAALERAKANLKRYRAAVLKAAVEGKLTEAWRAEHHDTEPASKLLERILAERRQKWEADQLAKFAAAEKEPPKNWKAKYVEPTPPDTTGLPELPEGWCWAKLEQLLYYLRNGYFQSPTGATSGTPILRINAVRPMNVDLGESRFLDKIKGSVDDYFIEEGDLLFTRYNGSVDLLGVAGMVRGCSERMLHPDKLIRVKLVLADPMPAFVEIAANVGASRKHMAGRARTTAGQTGISGTDVREMPIPLPPLEEQRQIVAEVAERLSQIDAAETVIDHSLVRATRLRQSILKQAFEGKLVPQDPTDEPASVLLERLRAKQATYEGNGKADTPARTRGRRAKSKMTEGRADQ